jgi:NAD+ kinase
VCADKQSTDWFHATPRTLKWNERERQKSFIVVEERRVKEEPKRRQHSEPMVSTSKVDEEDEVSEVGNPDEEEEEFDIDGLSFENSDAAPPLALACHPQELRLHPLRRRRALWRQSWG